VNSSSSVILTGNRQPQLTVHVVVGMADAVLMMIDLSRREIY
jgi:hypothetical protein